MNGKRKLLSTLFATALLAACGGAGMHGTYSGGMGSITFASGKADVKLLGSTREVPYSVDGSKVVLHSADAGNLVLTLNQDGSLATPWGLMRPLGAFGGAYRTADGSATATFASGKVTFSSADHQQAFEAAYSVDGPRVTVHAPQGDVVFTRNDDGTLDSPGGKFLPTH